MADQDVDEYGIPKKTTAPATDEFGIPIKKKISSEPSSTGTTVPSPGSNPSLTDFTSKPDLYSPMMLTKAGRDDYQKNQALYHPQKVDADPGFRHPAIVAPLKNAPETFVMDETKNPVIKNKKADNSAYDAANEDYKKKHPDTGSWDNALYQGTTSLTEAVTKPVAAVSSIMRDLIGKSTTKPNGTQDAREPLFDKDGNLTDYGVSVDAGSINDPLGKLIIGLDSYGHYTDLERGQKKLPDTFLGNTAQGMIDVAPDIAITSLFPESKIAEGGNAAVGMLKGAVNNPFTKWLAVKGGLESYSEAEQKGATPGEATIEGGKGAIKGLANGAEMSLAGGIGAKVTNKAFKAFQDAGLVTGSGVLTKAGLRATADAAIFAALPIGHAAITTGFNELTGKENDPELWDNAMKEAQSGAGMGMGFSLLQAYHDVKNNEQSNVHINEVLGDRQAIAMKNFMAATPEAITEVFHSPVESGDMNAKAVEYANKAREEKDPDKKQQLAILAQTFAKSSDVKGTTEAIIDNKQGFIDGIENSDLHAEDKKQLIDKINEVHKNLDPIEQQKTAMGNQITELDQSIANNQDRLTQATDPIEQADAQVVDDKLTKEKAKLEKDLKKLIAKQYGKKPEPVNEANPQPLPEEPPANEAGKPEDSGTNIDEKTETPVKDEQPETKVPEPSKDAEQPAKPADEVKEPIAAEAKTEPKEKKLSKKDLQSVGESFKKRFGTNYKVISPKEADDILSKSHNKNVFFQILDDVDLFHNTNPGEAKRFIDKVFRTVDNEKDAKTAYKKLAIKYHPDKGGSDDVMKYLNDANDKYKSGNLPPSGSSGNENNTADDKYQQATDDFIKNSNIKWQQQREESARQAKELREKLNDLQARRDSAIKKLSDGYDSRLFAAKRTYEETLKKINKKLFFGKGLSDSEIRKQEYEARAKYQSEISSIKDNYKYNLDSFHSVYATEASKIRKAYGYSFQRNVQGNVGGFYDKESNTAYLVHGVSNDTTAIHEMFSHPFIKTVELEHSELFDNLLKESMKDAQVKDHVDLKYNDTDEQTKNHEYIAAAIDLEARGQLKNKTLIDHIKEFWNAVKGKITETFGKKVTDFDKNTSISDIVKFVLNSDESLDLSIKSTGDQTEGKTPPTEDKKPTEPAKTDEKTGDQSKVKTTGEEIDVPALKKSPYRIAYAEVNGKHGVFEVNSGKLVSKLYGSKEELMDNFDKNKDRLTPEAIKKQLDVKSSAFMTLPYTSEFIEHDVKPVLEKLGGTFKDSLRALVHAVSPKTGVSMKALDTITTNLNSRNEASAALDKAVGQIEKMFDKMKDPERIDFIDRLKTGQKQATPELQEIADAYKQMDKDLYEEIAKHKGSLPFKEDHFRVLWKTLPGSEGKERKWYSLARRPLEGSKGFFKKATLADMSEGIARGGVPVSTNPMTMFKLAHADAMRFVTASRMFEALKSDGFVKFVKNGQDAPDGFVKIKDKIANVYFPAKEGLVKTGEYYIEENSGRLVNNHLSADLIREGSLGRGLMDIKNMYTAAELGLSGYHASAIALEGVSSDIGRGFRKLVNLGLRGNMKMAGEGIMDILKAPFSPKTTFSLGRNFIKLTTQKDFENSEFGKKFLADNPEAKQYVHDFFMGGGLMKQSEDLKSTAFKGLKEQAGKENYIGAALRAIPALNELVMSPLFDTFIPAMKVGMFMKEFPLALSEQQGRIDKGKISREAVARKTINFIDDRLGEMNFDNLFWDRTFKTSMQLMLRSVTWKLGNLRAMGGAPIEQAQEFYNAAKENRAPLLEPKLAWVLGLATMQVALSAVTQYMFTGKHLQTVKDIIAPQIDEKDDKQRMILPTYVKDVMHLTEKGPVDYVKSSLAGDVSKLADVWSNSDFQKYQIYSPEESLWQNTKDITGYVMPKPISVSSLQKSIKQGDKPHEMAMSFFGLNKAPKYLTEPAIENKIFDLYNSHEGVRSKGQKEQDDVKKQIRELYKRGKGEDAERLANEAIDKGLLKKTQVNYMISHIGSKTSPALYFFDKLPDDDKMYLYKEMTEKERLQFDPHGKVARLVQLKEQFENKQKQKEKSFSILNK